MGNTARVLTAGLILTSILLYVYWPALTGAYVYHDDVNFFLTTPHQPYPKSYQLSLAIGRFVGAPVYALEGRLVRDIPDLRIIRWIAFGQLWLCAALMYRLLRRHRWPRMVAAALATALVTLPAFQIIAAMAGYAFQMTGVVLALLAVSLADMPAPDRLSRLWRSPALWGAGGLFLAAIATHPSTAMFYWTGTALILSRTPAPSANAIIKKGVVLFSLGSLTMCAYAVLLKLTRSLHPPTELGLYNPYDWNTDVLAKIAWFFREPLVNAVNLWDIFPSATMATATAVLWGLAGTASLLLHKGERSSTAWRGAWLGTALLLSFSTNLMAAGNAPFYRCCIALSAIVLVLWFTVGLWLTERVPPPAAGRIGLGAALLVLGWAAPTARGTLVDYRVRPSTEETRLIVDSMRTRNVFQFERIHVYYPDRTRLKNRYDEFGGPTASFKGDLVGLVLTGIRAEAARRQWRLEHLEFDFRQSKASLLLEDADGKQMGYHVTITGAPKNKAIHGTVPTLILDVPRLYTDSGPLSYLLKRN